MTVDADELALFGGTPAVTTPWRRDWPYVGSKEKEAVLDLLDRGVLSIYDRSGIIAEFEDAFAAYHAVDGVAPFALTHNAGTSALHGAYFGIGLQPGDEVIVPTYTFLATVTPLLHCGALPVFADMDRLTLTIDPASVEARLTSRTRAIVVTHMWGHPADMTALLAIAERHGLPLVEDCSHAHGAQINGRKVGTFGTVACFSLEGHKPMVAGEGGILVTRSREVYERAVLLGHFGRRAKDEVSIKGLADLVNTGLGHKYRMHPLGAAVALHQLGRLDKRNEQRKANLDLLSELLNPIPGIEPPVTLPGTSRGGWYGYKPRYITAELDGLPMPRYMEALKAEGVEVKLPGSAPLHRDPLFRLNRGEARALALPWAESLPIDGAPMWDCPVADRVYPTLLSLPTFSGECRTVVEQYAAAFMKVARGYASL